MTIPDEEEQQDETPQAATPESAAGEPETPPAPAAQPEVGSPVEATSTPAEGGVAPAAERPAASAEGGMTRSEGAPRPRPSGDRGPRRDDGEGPRRRHFGRRRVCIFCAEKVKSIDYKDSLRLRRFLSDRARIEPRRKTGTCAKHQRWLAVALKRARHLALLPYTPEHIRVSGVSTGRGR